ncbi:MAG: tryptophan synthase subunit alpha [Candidatus Zixiibacteriota bacterium]
MSRINILLSKRGSRKLLVPFFTAGFPDRQTTRELVLGAVDAGADMVELGFPFSDPLADGPSIQFSSQIALSKGASLAGTLSLVSDLRKETEIPLLLMGYVNPILAFGIEKFCAQAAKAGVDGLIFPDLPVDEAGELQAHSARNGLSLTFLASPTTSSERLKLIDRHSTDFVYAVTVAGVTGARKLFDTTTDTYLKGLRRQLKKPFVAGFGVSTPETAAHLASFSDGVVIGSALVEIIRRSPSRDKQVVAVAEFLKSIRKALI